MNVFFYFILSSLCVIIFILLVKVYLLKKSAKEIREKFEEKINEETNTLVDISSGDKDMRELAASLNRNVAEMNNLRHKYSCGDEEIKKAVTNISHDLRTPLTAISGYLELLKKEEKSESAERYLEIIENRTEAMKGLTEEMFRFSMVTSSETQLNLTEINICSLVEESLADNYVILKEKGISPQIEMPESIMVVTDKKVVFRIFGNIITNAAKYSDGDLKIVAKESGVVEFSNTAKGLSVTQVSRLFDRFYTVNDARQSTGLGLSISKELVHQLGGTINAEYENDTLTISVNI